MSRSISMITPADVLGTRGPWHRWASMVLAHFPQFARRGCSYLREQRGNLSAITFHRNSHCLSLPWWLSCTTLSFKNVIFIFTVFWGKHAYSFIHSAFAEHPACTRHRGLNYLVSRLSQRQEREKDEDSAEVPKTQPLVRPVTGAGSGHGGGSSPERRGRFPASGSSGGAAGSRASILAFFEGGIQQIL